jgi:DNA-binding IclR family transcriptional regulator
MIAAISATIPPMRMSRERMKEIRDLVLEAARRISERVR